MIHLITSILRVETEATGNGDSVMGVQLVWLHRAPIQKGPMLGLTLCYYPILKFTIKFEKRGPTF